MVLLFAQFAQCACYLTFSSDCMALFCSMYMVLLFAQIDFHILFYAMSHPRKNRQKKKCVCVCVCVGGGGGGLEGIEWVRLPPYDRVKRSAS